MSTTIKALPTTYAGVEFRSRIEARWALFFDQLGVTWAYEPEGYALPSGNYLPDFWLPSISGGCWFEVKGVNPTDTECQLMLELTEATGHVGVIAHGDMPRQFTDIGHDIPWGAGQFDIMRIGPGWDNHYAWCICFTCGRLGLEFDARSERICNHDPNRNKDRNGDHSRIVAAYETARTHRFWKPGAA